MRCTRRLTGLCTGRRKPERADIYFQIKDFIGSMVGVLTIPLLKNYKQVNYVKKEQDLV